MATAEQLATDCAAAMWAGDRASQGLDMQLVAVAPGSAVMAMPVREDMVNGHAICHGGFIFTLADSSFAFACNSENFTAVAAAAHIDFLAPAKLGDVLTATAQQRLQKTRTGIYDVTVRNQRGDLVALFRGNSHRTGGQLVTAINTDTNTDPNTNTTGEQR